MAAQNTDGLGAGGPRSRDRPGTSYCPAVLLLLPGRLQTGCWCPVLHVRSHTAVLQTLRSARTLQLSPADQESKVGTSSSLSFVPVMDVIDSFLENQLRLKRTDEVILLL